MPDYSTRNALYLRISRHVVLPLYLYLDEKHVGWMNDATLRAVLSDLRPKLAAKFHAEDMSKKSQVEVHRGEFYQFAYFFRKMESRHVVLLKKREYTLQPLPPPKRDSQLIAGSPRARRGSRKRARDSVSQTPGPDPAGEGDVPPRTRPRRTPSGTVPNDDERDELELDTEGNRELEPADRGQAGLVADVNVNMPQSSSEPLFMPQEQDGQPRDNVAYDEQNLTDMPAPPIRVKEEPIDEDQWTALPPRADEMNEEMMAGARESASRTGLDTGLEDDLGGVGGGTSAGTNPQRDSSPNGEQVQIEEGEDEKKDFKPAVRMSYTGFSIHSRHLVLIIEPWPPLEPPTRGFSRPRSTFSRSMSRDLVARDRQSNSTFDMQPADRRSETPLIPNSRRGGTSSVSVTPGPGGSNRNASTPSPLVPNSRSASRRNSTDPFSRSDSVGPDGRSSTPLFRAATPMTEMGDDDDDEEDDDVPDWRSRAWSPWRRPSEPPEDLGYQDDGDLVAAKDMLSMSQALQDNTVRRTGSVAVGGADKDESTAMEDETDGADENMGGAD